MARFELKLPKWEKALEATITNYKRSWDKIEADEAVLWNCYW
jgi:hypothetical protein